MFIVKRDGSRQSIKLDKITKRIERQSKDLKNIDAVLIAQKVIQGLYDGVTSSEIDSLATETAYAMSIKHIEYDKLATRLAITSSHKETDSSFMSVIEKLHNVKDSSGNKKSLIDDKVYKFIKKHASLLDSTIDYSRDFLFDYFGYKTLARSYLLKIDNKIVERPAHMWARVACGIHYDDIDACLNTYRMLSLLHFTHATPTLFNSGTPKNQLSSCFLLGIKDDSIKGIYDTLTECALISQSAGGIGLHLHNVRCKGSPIYGTNGNSNGIIPFLRNFAVMCESVDQGGGKRKGSLAAYISPDHGDVMEFLELRKNNGKEEHRARSLNLALWCPDLFFKCVQNDDDWYLMDPNVSKGLYQVYDETIDGGSYTNLYNKYVSEGKFVKKIKARELWLAMIVSQIETGQPYVLAKDAGNRKSNQKNIGVISSSNLCCEIFEYSDGEETAVCNLGSISLSAMIDGKKYKRSFNFSRLEECVKTLVENLNKIIDIEFYPVESAKKSNLKHRPIGIGIQGLSDAFFLMRFAWGSDEAIKLNKEIAECIYYTAVKTSCELAKKQGSYTTFKGSPLSEGKFQFDLWESKPSDKYDWETLRKDVIKYGVSNSLLVSPMPTASSSQILGNIEAFEICTSNIYKRQTLSGEFIQLNKYLFEDLVELKIWNETVRQKIIASNGSIQNISEIPDDIKKLYLTVWETSQKIVIDGCADRAPFICQSQSMNLYFKDANTAKISSALMYAWQKGLKTLVYYTRNSEASSANKVTVSKEIQDQMIVANSVEGLVEGVACSLDNPEACEMCSG